MQMGQVHGVCASPVLWPGFSPQLEAGRRRNSQQKSRCAQTQTGHLSQVCIMCMYLFKGSWSLRLSVCDLWFISVPSIDFVGSKALQRKEFLHRSGGIHSKPKYTEKFEQVREVFCSWKNSSWLRVGASF